MLNVIVATDMSEAGLLGVESVLGCGPGVFGSVTLVHVVDLDLYTAGGSIPGIVEFAEDRLAEEVSRLAGAGIEATRVVAQGDAVDTIDRIARERDADAILVTNVGGSALTGRVLGTVAERIATGSRLPVFVQRVRIEAGGAACRIDAGTFTARVLVAAGLDEATPALLGRVATLPGVEAVRIVHVAAAPGDAAPGDAVARLERLVGEAGLGDIAEIAVVTDDDPVRVLIAEAASWNATLLATATRAHGFFDRLRWGSVASDLTRYAGCSVLLVPALLETADAPETVEAPETAHVPDTVEGDAS